VRILVIHPPVTLARDWIDYPYFSDLSAVQTAATLRAAGHEVALLDAYALSSSTLHFRRDGRGHLGASLTEVLDTASALGAFDLRVVMYTPFHRPPHRDDLLAALLRGLVAMSDAPLWLVDGYQSGQHYVDVPTILDAYPEASLWLKYEAEESLPELVASLARGNAPTGVHLGRAPASLDPLPLPAWDLVDLGAHDSFLLRVVEHAGRGHWSFPIDGRTLPMVTSRGCPFRCAHCSSNPGRAPGEPKTQRRLSATRMAEHLAQLAALGATRVEVLDELVNVNARHFDAFLELAEKHDLRFDVPNGFRADYLRHEHLLRTKGRVTTVSVSAESGSPRVLDEIVGKDLDLSHIHRVAEEAHAASVPLLIHWIVGLPGETPTEINETLTLALSLFDSFGAEPAVQFATPLPGTRLADPKHLPVLGATKEDVDDWGPRFQKIPSQPGALVSPETLLQFRRTFDARLAASRGPEKVIVNLTYACNNHCTFCAVGTRTQLHGNFDRQREFLDQYRERGVKMVDFDGGEPTLHPELLGIVRHARAVGYERINVTTNGRRLSYEPYAEAVVHSGLTTLLFSLHGPDARTHAQQVGVAEAFDETVAGIKNAARLKPAHVELGMNVTITKGNHRLIEALCELALSLELHWVNLQFLTPFGRATKWVAPDTGEAARIAMRAMDKYRDRIRFQVINLPFCFMPGYENLLGGDLLKLSRHMIFVNNESVNLADYLAERRVRKPECDPCPHRSFCAGFYELESAPEPPWLVRPEDLIRPAKALVSPRERDVVGE
jgi:MoaA/NifB/PqqE/SkfB family radical SAM enzyme